MLSDESYGVESAGYWTDDAWFIDQNDRAPEASAGWWPLRPGVASGRLVGGNLCTFNLLQGGPYRPSLAGAVVLVEDDELTNPVEFARDLTSLLQLPDAADLAALVIGRFQRRSGISQTILQQIIERQTALAGVPVLANIDVGHTNPLATLPIGGQVEVHCGDRPYLRVLR